MRFYRQSFSAGSVGRNDFVEARPSEVAPSRDFVPYRDFTAGNVCPELGLRSIVHRDESSANSTSVSLNLFIGAS
jgi:hypothetical protein